MIHIIPPEKRSSARSMCSLWEPRCEATAHICWCCCYI